MGFGNLGIGEILIIGLIVLLLFGAKRIPEVAGSFGKGIREFKRGVHDIGNAVSEPLPPPRARPAESVASEAEPVREPRRLL